MAAGGQALRLQQPAERGRQGQREHGPLHPLGTTSFTSTVSAPGTAASHTFSGSLRDFSKAETAVVGASALTVDNPVTGRSPTG